MSRTLKPHFKKEIFRSGEYIKYFRPTDKYNPFAGIYRRKKNDVIHMIRRLENAGNILDVGGGMGRLSLALAQTTENRVVLSDISVDMLKLAVEGAHDSRTISFVNTDAHRLPFRDSMFDVVVGLDLYCHLQNPEIALKEFHRVLKDSGVLIMDSTNSNPLWALFYPGYMGKNPIKWYQIMKFKGVFPGWEKIVNHYPKRIFFSALREVGFEVVHGLNYGPWICPKWHLAISKKAAASA
jgi:ubiquinone/menaquinone biosynthesis C-methylase UbiE